jgi:oxygen-independent coproporphyrinogen-3 oxidase
MEKHREIAVRNAFAQFDRDQCPGGPFPSNDRMTLKACILAEQAVPRYTSYPTAPHFNASVGANTYGDWLDALPAAATLSLYLHVPFCAKLCLYCGCHTKIVKRREPVEAYADSLGKEIDLTAKRTGKRRVVSIHWGGGTPSTLGTARTAVLARQLAAAFDCSAVAEHAIEIDPRHCGAELAQALASIGINRASLGVQEFAPHIQEAIGRIQPFGQVASAVAALRAAGITALNFDLMYGLPHQTSADLQHTIGLADTLKPSRIALFGYAHVPWFKTHQRLIDATVLPGAAERLAQAEAARKKLIALGYVPVGFDHFARPDDSLALAAKAGTLHRNFQGYTTDSADALIGFGASAIGRLPQGYVQNAPDIGGYTRAIEAGSLATTKGVAFTDGDRVRASIIERLMCDFKVDLDTVAADEDFAEAFVALEPLAADRLVTIDRRRIAVTETGRPFVRLAAAAFDAYLGRNAARHSRAV